MRDDWVPFSASALVIGAMSLVFGTLLNPAGNGESAVQTLRVVEESGGRWLAMAAMYFFASFTLTLGLPAILTLFRGRGRVLGTTGVAVFTIGAVGTSGFAMLMVFFKVMIDAGAVRPQALDMVAGAGTLQTFLSVWIAGFYGGLLLVALGLLRAGTTPRWVPVLLLVFVALFPFGSHLGRVGSALQVLALAVAFTGVAMAAVGDGTARVVQRQPSF